MRFTQLEKRSCSKTDMLTLLTTLAAIPIPNTVDRVVSFGASVFLLSIGFNLAYLLTNSIDRHLYSRPNYATLSTSK